MNESLEPQKHHGSALSGLVLPTELGGMYRHKERVEEGLWDFAEAALRRVLSPTCYRL